MQANFICGHDKIMFYDFKERNTTNHSSLNLE